MDDDVPQNFLERLKRHYIFRFAAVYAVAAWIIIQLFNNVLPNLGLPKDVVRFVIIVVALGFPVVLVLAWTFINPRDIDAAQFSRWKRIRLRIGSLLSIIIIVLVSISGWYLWRIAVIAHVAQEISKATPAINETSAFSPLPHSIAVLPFKNLSDDPNQQYFSDGITEELTSALGALPGVRVISWQSTSMYRGKNISITAIGKALNVANILVGSIHHDGDRIRISAELVNTVTGFQLWSAHYDRTFKDVFVIQDNISKAMVSALQLHLATTRPLVINATTDTDAHDLYLKGLAALNTATPANIGAAIKYFQQAIRLDTHYAQAYAALARTYAISHQYTNVPLAKSLPLAKLAARQALRLNPKLASAHEALGMVYALQQKTERAKTELLSAMKLDPNNARVHIIYASLLPANHYKEALSQYKLAASLDPNQAFAHYDLAYTYERLGDLNNAITEYQATLGLAPQLVFPRLDLARVYHRNGNDKSAVRILTGVKIDDPFQAQMLKSARLVYMEQQTPSLDKQAFTALRQIDINKASPSDKEQLVALFILVGQKDHAIQLLSQVCENAPETCGDIAVNPSYQALRNETAFKRLVEKYNLSR